MVSYNEINKLSANKEGKTTTYVSFPAAAAVMVPVATAVGAWNKTAATVVIGTTSVLTSQRCKLMSVTGLGSVAGVFHVDIYAGTVVIASDLPFANTAATEVKTHTFTIPMDLPRGTVIGARSASAAGTESINIGVTVAYY